MPEPPVSREWGSRRPLSPLQERLWFLKRLHPSVPMLTFPLLLVFDGELDVPALGRALAAVVSRHDVLAGRVTEVLGEPLHVVEQWPPALPVVSAPPPGPGQPADRDLTARLEALPPLGLAPGQMLAARLIRCGPVTHVLELLIQHLAFDGNSASVLVGDLCAAYRAVTAGREPAADLPRLPLRYADFAVWQRDWVEGPEGKALAERWRKALAGAEEVSIATDRPRRAPRSFRCGAHTFSLGPELAGQVRQFAAANGATTFMALAAVYGVLIARRSGQESDFMIGMPHSARHRPQWAPMMGLFANMVPLRMPVSGRPSFRELVRAVRAEVLRIIVDGDLPFDRIVAEREPLRDQSRLPLCPVSFQVDYDLLAKTARLTGGLTVRRLLLPREWIESELVMFVADGPDLPVVVEYATELLDPDTVRRIGDEYRDLCQELLRDPDRPVAEAGHHGRRLAAMLAGAAGPEPSLPEPTLHALFRRQAGLTPHATAVAADGGRMTYRELDTASDEVARRLRAAGVRRHDLVAVAVPRAALPAAALGVLKAGAAYLPAGPRWAPPRRSWAEAGPDAIVTEPGHAEQAAASGLPVVTIEPGIAGPASPGAATPVPDAAGGDDLACVLVSEAGAGRPKVVGVPHLGLLTLAQRPGFLGLTGADVVAGIAPAETEAAAFELWACLLSGATLALAGDSRMSPAGLLSFVQASGASVLHLPGSSLQLIADECPQVFAGLRLLIVTGRPAPASLLRQIADASPALRVSACYGAAEAGVFACASSPDGAGPGGLLPLPGRRVHVLDPWGHPAAPGVAGDIMVGADGLAHGYLNQPGRTADRFVPDPFRPGQRLYRSGDLGRVRQDGAIDVVGRAGRRITLRGRRVEPAETEAALAALPGVADCMVGVADAAGEPVLAGYVVARPGTYPDPAWLRSRLQDRLPPSSVPASILLVPSLPATGGEPAGPAAPDLPEPPAGGPAGPAGPLTATGVLVSDVMSEVLGIAGAEPDTSFFDLGGHSLAALRVVARLERRLARSIPVSAIFEQPSVRQLAAWIDESRAEAAAAAPAAPGHADAGQLLAEVTGATEADIAALLAEAE
jgi:non-ribosomal peptide synthetase component F/acyl carrier protein